jgi:formylglycine-generating enzyme required for sulfatase activity
MMKQFARAALLSSLFSTWICGSSLLGRAIGGEHAAASNVRSESPPPGPVPSDRAQRAAPARSAVTNSIGMRLVPIAPGEFEMGSSRQFVDMEMASDTARRDLFTYYVMSLRDECPQHKVRIAKRYWMAATKTTQEEYERLMGTNPSHFRGDAKRPVENVSWYDAVEFCRKLSELPEEKASNRRYQLPTEAQWEYACRAGNEKAWCFSQHEGAASAPEDRKLLAEFAWFNENSGRMTHPVAQKKPNAWGLYDVYGNVGEWCQDWHARYTGEPAVDPTGPWGNILRPASGSLVVPTGSYVPGLADGWRIVRGGSYGTVDFWCRSALRDGSRPEFRRDHTGFRVCAVIEEPPPRDARETF